MSQIDTETKLCAVIGNPIGHSLSPRMHNAAFEAAGLNYVYLAFQIEDVSAFLAGMRAMPSFRGCSVTIPHKRAVMPHLDAVEPMAERVGSVNTITNENGRLIGATTDGPGALKAFADAGIGLEGRNVLFLGNGGAVRAVAFAVAEFAKAARVTILGRDRARAAELARDLRNAGYGTIETGTIAADLGPAMETHDVIIQGTPVGMHPHGDKSLIPAELLQPRHVVFDMVYQPHETRLIRDARNAGSSVIHGIEMLINQAALQFERWTGQPPPAGSMRSAVSALWRH